MSKSFSQFLNILIFIFPIVICLVQVAGDIVLFVIAMMGMFIIITKRISPFNIKEIKVFSYLSIGYFTAVCLSVLFSNQAQELAHYIPRDFYFLFAPIIALVFYKAEMNFNYLLTGTKVALLILGMMTLYQLMLGEDRHYGVMNPNVLGNLTVSMFFIVLPFFQHESLKYKLFTLVSLISGLLTIIVSGSRGAWLSFIMLIGIYLYFLYKQKNKLNKKLKIILVVITISLLSIGSFNQTIKDRVNESIHYASVWLSGTEEERLYEDLNSVSLRFHMYQKALDNINDVPFFGHGYRTSNITLFKNDLDIMGLKSVQFNHLHNAYLTNYFNGGVVLLGALLLLLFLPLRIFIKTNIQNRENPVFISGAILTLGYASFGMVNILFGDTYMNGFYVFFLAIILLITNKSIKGL